MITLISAESGCACGAKKRNYSDNRNIFLIVAVILTLCLSLIMLSPSVAEELTKKPNVAGGFYPASKEELKNTLDSFYAQVPAQAIEGNVVALISPHAGYQYSGQVAAYGYKLISAKKYNTVIIIAPSHHELFEGVSVWNKGPFETPLGFIEVDKQMAGAIIAKNPKKISFYYKAYEQEHSLEVQLPFLQTSLSNFSAAGGSAENFGGKIVPIIVGEFSYSICEILSDAIKDAVGQRQDVLIVASTDMSHYHPYENANAIDSDTVSCIKNYDIDRTFDGLISGKNEMCGGMPVLITMMAAKKLGADSTKILKYANSGDTTGDKSRVVGYLSAVIYKSNSSPKQNVGLKEEGEIVMLNVGQKKRLLEIARQSMEGYVKDKKRIEFEEKDPVLLRRQGAFVTLKKHGDLRGCIGHIYGNGPLYQTVADMAIEAAVGDQRFVYVLPSEFKDITIEISVLSPVEEITDVGKIEVGKHGIIIRKGPYSGLLLPQVATDYKWNREEFLKHTCLKAGLPEDAWKKDAQISIFSAEVFREDELR